MNDTVVEYLYILAIVFFVVSLKWMSEVKTSRYGNWIAASGMAVAIGATLLAYQVQRVDLLVGAVIVGTVIGMPIALEGPNDSRPAADGRLSRVRVAGRGPGRDGGVLSEASEHRRIHDYGPLGAR